MPTAAVIAACLLWVFWDGLRGYLVDQHYQEHFVYLWCFVALALRRTLHGPYRSRFTLCDRRDLTGALLALTATLTLALALASGSSTLMRFALVLLVTGLSVLAVTSWSVSRCFMHGALLQLCFGVPYSFYFPLTNKLRWGVLEALRLPTEWGLADYRVQDNIVRFDHYELAITADCSGVGQLLTFAGIAALGVLVSAPSARRAAGIFALAVALAWLSNLARVSVFVLLVGAGWTGAVDDPAWHSGVGFAVFLPFVAALVAAILRTHRPLPAPASGEHQAGRWPVAALLVPVVTVHLLFSRAAGTNPEPPYFAALSSPPGHELVVVAPSQDSDRITYETPWLIGARFQRDDGAGFDLLHYSTRSRSHLCIHKVADCLTDHGHTANYAPAVNVNDRRWWPVAFEGTSDASAYHAYYCFEVAGRRRDDSVWTQLEAIYRRAVEGNWEVRLTRVVMPGPLPSQPSAYASEVLAWLDETVTQGR